MTEEAAAPISVRDTLERVASEIEARPEPVAAPKPAPAPAPRETASADTPAPAAAPETPDEPPEGRHRDQFGRFMSASPEGPKPGAAAPPATATPDQPEHAGAPEQITPSAALPAIGPPAAWSEPGKAQWATLPRAVQEEIQRRESDADKVLRERAEQVNEVAPLRDLVARHGQRFAMRGINPVTALEQLLAFNELLERDPIGGVARIAQTVGVDLRQYGAALDAATRQSQSSDPNVRALAEQVQQLQSIQAQQQQQQQAYAQQQEQARLYEAHQQIEAFRADTAAHPFFEQVRPTMQALLQNRMAANLQDAYVAACKLNPEVERQMQAAQQRAAAAANGKAERDAAERARRASVSVSGVPSGANGALRKTAGSLRDRLEANFDALASR